MFDDIGELSRLNRALIQSVTLYRDGKDAMIMWIES